jgi:TetR/AcrR family transcriptional repressor of nem operon
MLYTPIMNGQETSSPPITRKGRATRDRIVAAAARLTYDRGVAGTSIEDVQIAANASGSQMYHYFRNKAELVRAVILRQTDTVLGGQESLLSNLDSLEGLYAWRDFIVDHRRALNCTGACPLGSLASELAESDAIARADLAAAFSRWAAAIALGLRRMQSRGDLQADAEPDRLAFALLAAAQGGLLLTQAMRDLVPLEAALDTVIAQVASLMTPARGWQGAAAVSTPGPRKGRT